MRVVPDENVDRVQVYRRRRVSRALLIARSFQACDYFYRLMNGLIIVFVCGKIVISCSLSFYGFLNARFSLVEMISNKILVISGGYSSGVPPLPISNRAVKPTCADGTAMQCGRVGSCLFY